MMHREYVFNAATDESNKAPPIHLNSSTPPTWMDNTTAIILDSQGVSSQTELTQKKFKEQLNEKLRE